MKQRAKSPKLGAAERLSKPKENARRYRATAAKKPSLPDFCRSLPKATEDIKWGKDLVFSIGDKMFAVFDSNDLKKFSFKTTTEKFALLTSTDGIVPVPYAP